jgi:hypothetical protein
MQLTRRNFEEGTAMSIDTPLRRGSVTAISPTTKLWSMILTRALAVSITAAVGAAGFALSFTALRDLVTRGNVPPGQAWLWPLMVDGAILLATLGVVVMAGDPQCRNDRRFFWGVLGGGAAVSIACNALHAILPVDQPLNPWLRGFVAGVAPTALLVTTHGLTLLTRMHRRAAALAEAITTDGRRLNDEGADHGQLTELTAEHAAVATTEMLEHTTATTDVDPIEIPADSKWHGIAPRVLERESFNKAGRADVAQVLYLSYEHNLPHRDIGRRVGMSHHTVSKVVRAAEAELKLQTQHSMSTAS